MRILHTGDWHLGKKLDYFSRLAEQREVMAEIVDIATTEKVDAVIVAGDLYDNYNPASEASELLFKTLKALSNNGARPVIAIAGNHDSADRIHAPDPLARECGIFFYGYPNTDIGATTLDSGLVITQSAPGFTEILMPGNPVPLRILTTPFANEQRLRTFLGLEGKDAAMNEYLKKEWQHLADTYCDDNGINLLAAHLFVMQRGGSVPDEPEGENPIHIGTAAAVFTDIIPDQIQYTALGHLHRAHSVPGARGAVWYSGSPLSYSFSEAGQVKQVNIIDAAPGKPVQIRALPLTKGRPVIRHTAGNVTEALNWLEQHQQAIVALTVHCEHFLEAADRLALLKAHRQLINIIPAIKNKQAMADGSNRIDLSQSAEALFIQYFKSRHNNTAPDQTFMNLIKELFANEL